MSDLVSSKKRGKRRLGTLETLKRSCCYVKMKKTETTLS